MATSAEGRWHIDPAARPASDLHASGEALAGAFDSALTTVINGSTDRQAGQDVSDMQIGTTRDNVTVIVTRHYQHEQDGWCRRQERGGGLRR
ncbi:hypothetical protein BaRGS_00008203, partial [Batillaria attramentaria]